MNLSLIMLKVKKILGLLFNIFKAFREIIYSRGLSLIYII
nr:MAG TPA: hypothetical protein [Caudoviricetes sp.]